MGEKQKKKKKSHVPFRLNILFLFVFLLFTILILRLGYVQIVEGEEYKKRVEKTENKTSKLDAARGKILDAHGNVLVGNKSEYAITYTRTTESRPIDRLELATKLAKFIEKGTEKVTERDKKDYWILKRGLNTAYDLKLTEEELEKFKGKEGNQEYDLLLDRITEEDLAQISKKDLEIVAIKRELDTAMNLTPHYVKTGLTKEAYFRIGEHLEMFDGKIHTAISSERRYPEGWDYILGNIGAISKIDLNYFLVRGYDHNDQVGTSGLEQYYETEISGWDTKIKYVTQDGIASEKPTRIEGRRGYDLVLTVNSQLQKRVNNILEEEILKGRSEPKNRRYLKSAYVVIANPNTGGVLTLAGKEYDVEKNEFSNASYGTYLKSFAVGSVVKGATVLAGFETGKIPSGGVYDKPMVFQRGNDFTSWQTSLGYINSPQEALEISSNIYMGFITGNMAGFNFRNGGSGHIATYVPPANSKQFVHAFKTLRQVYSQFGLGVSTGIDLPTEEDGYDGGLPDNPGQILRFAIGQYDTYTPVQLVQYVSTIANGGYRMQLHLLKEIREPASKQGELGKVVHRFEPNVMNHISMSDSALDIVQEGFWQVTHGNDGTAEYWMNKEPYSQYEISGKTGTADIDVNHNGVIGDSVDTINSTFVAYAPYDDPEVAISVVVPGAESGHVNLKIARRVFEAYFNLKHGIQ